MIAQKNHGLLVACRLKRYFIVYAYLLQRLSKSHKKTASMEVAYQKQSSGSAVQVLWSAAVFWKILRSSHIATPVEESFS